MDPRRSILVVDDDPAFRDLAETALVEMGFSVVGQAEDAASALTAAMATEPGAILVDVGLPDRRGVDLAAELTVLPWGPWVVLTSVNPEAAGAEEIHRSGARGFFPKSKLVSGTLPTLLELE